MPLHTVIFCCTHGSASAIKQFSIHLNSGKCFSLALIGYSNSRYQVLFTSASDGKLTKVFETELFPIFGLPVFVYKQVSVCLNLSRKNLIFCF